MNSVLLPLLPRTITFRDRDFRVLKDRHIFDSVDVLTTDGSAQFFVTISSKKKSQAIFTGDFSLVKEANLYLVVQQQALTRDRVLTEAEFLTFFMKGYFTWNVIVPETVTVDEDRLEHVADGPGIERFSTQNALNEAVPNARRYDLRRTYLVGANKIVPGGRAIEYTITWPEAAGNGLTTTTSVSVVFSGGEYEPGK